MGIGFTVKPLAMFGRKNPNTVSVQFPFPCVSSFVNYQVVVELRNCFFFTPYETENVIYLSKDRGFERHAEGIFEGIAALSLKNCQCLAAKS